MGDVSGAGRLESIALPSVKQFLERRIALGAERRGLGVMLLGQFFRRRTGGGVNDSEIKMRVGVIGIIGDGFEDFSLGRFLPAFLAGGNPEIIVRRRAPGIDRERLG